MRFLLRLALAKLQQQVCQLLPSRRREQEPRGTGVAARIAALDQPLLNKTVEVAEKRQQRELAPLGQFVERNAISSGLPDKDFEEDAPRRAHEPGIGKGPRRGTGALARGSDDLGELGLDLPAPGTTGAP